MPRGKPNAPTPLDRFLETDFRALQKVMNEGRLDVQFYTDNQAMNTKSRLWRLRSSLLYYKPNEPLSQAAKTFMFKRQGNRLTIIDRATSEENNLLLRAIEGGHNPYAISDAQERDTEIQLEQNRKQTEQFIQELVNGNEDK